MAEQNAPVKKTSKLQDTFNSMVQSIGLQLKLGKYLQKQLVMKKKI